MNLLIANGRVVDPSQNLDRAADVLDLARAALGLLAQDAVRITEFMAANHATLAGHTFEHELQVAADAGVLGSIDANRGDNQNGWDTDQFPNNVNELTEAMLVLCMERSSGRIGR